MAADTPTPAAMTAEDIEWVRRVFDPDGWPSVHRLLATLDAKDAEIALLRARFAAAECHIEALLHMAMPANPNEEADAEAARAFIDSLPKEETP